MSVSGRHSSGHGVEMPDSRGIIEFSMVYCLFSFVLLSMKFDCNCYVRVVLTGDVGLKGNLYCIKKVNWNIFEG